MAATGPGAPILIWTAGTGGGHRGVARAIVEAAQRLALPAGSIRVDEPLERASPAVRRLLAAYGPLVRHAPLAWGGLFHLTQAPALGRLVAAGFERALVPALRAELVSQPVAVVLVVHPLLVGPALAARAALPGTVPAPAVVVLVTDLAGGHRSWAHPSADWTLTASEEATRWARGAGVSPRRTRMVGLPVHPDLAGPPPDAGPRRRLRIALGLDPDRFAVLVTGGGEGAGPVAATVGRLLCSGLAIQVAVVCGRNRRLAARLAGWRAPVPLRVAGWVDDMPGWLRAADLVVGKAGPSSVAETAAAGLPLLLVGALPGQERPNLRLVEGAGFGAPVRAQDLVRTVAQLSAPGSGRYRAMCAAARLWGRPGAAFTTVELLASLASARPTP